MTTYRRVLGVLTLGFLLAGSGAHAQGFPGGGGRGGGRGGSAGAGAGSGGGGVSGRGGDLPSGSSQSAPPTKDVVANKVDLVGVVKEIGPADRITIDYEDAPALTPPAGSRSFVVGKTSLLEGVTVGEHVRFRLDSQEISVLAPFNGDRSQLSDGTPTPNPGGGQFGRGAGAGGPGSRVTAQ